MLCTAVQPRGTGESLLHSLLGVFRKKPTEKAWVSLSLSLSLSMSFSRSQSSFHWRFSSEFSFTRRILQLYVDISSLDWCVSPSTNPALTEIAHRRLSSTSVKHIIHAQVSTSNMIHWWATNYFDEETNLLGGKLLLVCNSIDVVCTWSGPIGMRPMPMGFMPIWPCIGGICPAPLPFTPPCMEPFIIIPPYCPGAPCWGYCCCCEYELENR